MIYDDVKKELLNIFIHMKNGRTAITRRKNLAMAKQEFADAYELAHKLMEFLKKQKTTYPELEKVYEKLGAAYSKIFDAWHKRELSEAELVAICKDVENTTSTEAINMDIIKKQKAAA